MVKSGNAEWAIHLYREADELWHGSALGGLPGDWLARIRAGLEDERRTAILERTELELCLGRHTEIIGELRYLLARYPLDESFVAQQMKAFYRCGRQADALRLYLETYRRLGQEQGTEPGPELSELHRRILRQDQTLAVTPIYQQPEGTPQPNTLPPAPAEFVGRADELRILTRRHSHPGIDPSVKIIEGMPGVGKTALAVKAGHDLVRQLPDAQIYLNFGAHDPGKTRLAPGEAAYLLLRMLDIPAARIPSGLEQRASLCRAELSHRRAVIVLDDVPGAEEIRPLLPSTGNCTILVTTRLRLHGAADAETLTLRVLPDREAQELFVQIAGAERTRDFAAVTKIVQLCGGLPLVIQVAASRVAQDSALSLRALQTEISLFPSSTGHGGTSAEQVSSAFEFSYLGLADDAQRFFRRLAVNPCPDITPHTAAALAGTSLATAQRALDVLLDHHLLEQASPGRVRFHDLIRAYALSRAAADDPEPERRRAISRLLDFYLCAADRADRILYPHRRRLPVQVAQHSLEATTITTSANARAWLEAERRNILQAAAYAAQHEMQYRCIELIHGVGGYLEASGCWDEAITAHELALRSCREIENRLAMARIALDLSHVCQQAGRYQEAIGHAEDAAASYRSLTNTQGEAEALHRLGTIWHHLADFHKAIAYYHEARILFTQVSDNRGMADTLDHAGIACWCLGRYPEASRYLEDALSLYRRAGDRRGEASVLNNLGEMQRYRGYYRDATEKYEQAFAIFEEIGVRQNQAALRHNRGIVHQYKGNYSAALTAYLSALTAFREMGDLRNQATALNDIGTTYLAMCRYDEAIAHHELAKAMADDIGNGYERMIALRGIADARRGQGSWGQATTCYGEALRLAREIGDPYQQARILEELAEAIRQTKGHEAARIYWRQALDIFKELGLPEAEVVAIRLQNLGAAPR